MELVQPQVVKFNSNTDLPDIVQNKYYIYYVISGLFDETNCINAIYVNLDSIDKLHNFISDIRETDISLLFTGDDNFVLGLDYFMNESLYKTLSPNYNIQENVDEDDIDNEMQVEQLFYLPDYMTINGYNFEFFEYTNNYDTLFDYFKKQNKYTDLTFDEEYLKDFYVNFSKLILELTIFIPFENIDYIYKQVLNYFVSYQTDDVYIGMSLIFNTLYGVAQQTDMNCGCGSDTSTQSICTTSCNDYYKNAMIEYIKTMFGDYTFYQKWFFITDETTGLTQVNQMMVDKLRLFINEFLLLDININTSKNTSNCMCPSIDNTSDECNRGIIKNFLSILYFVETNTIEENSNRIKVYGNEFGNIFHQLIF